MTSLTTLLQPTQIGVGYTFTKRPCNVTHTTLTDTPTRCIGCKFTKNL